LKLSDPSTGFRLPQPVLATVDSICAKQDLTRSQVFRRSIMEYLKTQNIEIITEVKPPEPKLTWSTDLFNRRR
jgi:Ribbon-helix-helix protein, copG family